MPPKCSRFLKLSLFLSYSLAILRVALAGGQEIHGSPDSHSHSHTHSHSHSEDFRNLTASESLVELYGGDGIVFESELEVLFHELSEPCEQGDRHQHARVINGAETVVTPSMLVEEYGSEGGLDPAGFERACSDVLRCQLLSNCELRSEVHDDEDKENTTGLKLFMTLVLFIEAMVGAIIPMFIGQVKKFNFWLSIMNCFAGGVFLATGFTHLLPLVHLKEDEVEGLGEYPLGTLVVVIGFMIVFFVEHVLLDSHSSNGPGPMFHHGNHDGNSKSGNPHQPQQVAAVSALHAKPPEQKDGNEKKLLLVGNPMVLLLAISVHATLESVTLGLKDHKNDLLLLFATIGSHKGVASMALSARFIRNHATKMQLIGFMTMFSLVAPVGILIGMAVSGISALALLILDALAAGAFIYVGAHEVIADELHGKPSLTPKCKKIKFMAFSMGVALISFLQLIPHEEQV